MKIANSKLKIFTIVVVLVLAMCTFLSGCKAGDGNSNTGNEIENSEVVIDENGEQFATEIETGTPIDTKYITLNVPADLEEKLSVEKDKEGGAEKIIFSTEISDEELELFTIVMSEDEHEGYKMGTIKDDNSGDIIVTVQMNEQKADDWSEEEFDRINDLQERVNDFIYQIAQDERFVPEK